MDMLQGDASDDNSGNDDCVATTVTEAPTAPTTNDSNGTDEPARQYWKANVKALADHKLALDACSPEVHFSQIVNDNDDATQDSNGGNEDGTASEDSQRVGRLVRAESSQMQKMPVHSDSSTLQVCFTEPGPLGLVWRTSDDGSAFISKIKAGS
eukprot:SAG31_NODE_25262_length_461_cov_25.545205_1_plen_153_part_11